MLTHLHIIRRPLATAAGRYRPRGSPSTRPAGYAADEDSVSGDPWQQYVLDKRDRRLWSSLGGLAGAEVTTLEKQVITAFGGIRVDVANVPTIDAQEDVYEAALDKADTEELEEEVTAVSSGVSQHRRADLDAGDGFFEEDGGHHQFIKPFQSGQADKAAKQASAVKRRGSNRLSFKAGPKWVASESQSSTVAPDFDYIDQQLSQIKKEGGHGQAQIFAELDRSLKGDRILGEKRDTLERRRAESSKVSQGLNDVDEEYFGNARPGGDAAVAADSISFRELTKSATRDLNYVDQQISFEINSDAKSVTGLDDDNSDASVAARVPSDLNEVDSQYFKDIITTQRPTFSTEPNVSRKTVLAKAKCADVEEKPRREGISALTYVRRLRADQRQTMPSAAGVPKSKEDLVGEIGVGVQKRLSMAVCGPSSADELRARDAKAKRAEENAAKAERCPSFLCLFAPKCGCSRFAKAKLDGKFKPLDLFSLTSAQVEGMLKERVLYHDSKPWLPMQ